VSKILNLVNLHGLPSRSDTCQRNSLLIKLVDTCDSSDSPRLIMGRKENGIYNSAKNQ
jgi:hypothetical protein